MPIEQAFIVCMRVEDLEDPVEGSTRTACVECGCDLWISIESRRVAAEKKAMPLCGPCGLRLAKEEPTMVAEIGDPSVGQLNEISKAIKSAAVTHADLDDAELEALAQKMPEGWEDMDGFEVLKHSARTSALAMKGPQDDWGSMVIMESYEGNSLPPVPLSKMLESGIPKEIIAKQLLPALAHASNAKRVMFALSAWTLDGEQLPELKGSISEHADRKEALVLIDVTADGVVGMSTALITRDGINGPTLGEWKDAEKPEKSDGLFVEALIPVLVLIKSIRESGGV